MAAAFPRSVGDCRIASTSTVGTNARRNRLIGSAWWSCWRDAVTDKHEACTEKGSGIRSTGMTQKHDDGANSSQRSDMGNISVSRCLCSAVKPSSGATTSIVAVTNSNSSTNLSSSSAVANVFACLDLCALESALLPLALGLVLLPADLSTVAVQTITQLLPSTSPPPTA